MAPPKLTPEERLQRLEALLEVRFEDPALGLCALTHKSYSNENKGSAQDNERLEFLGDAVVDLAISHRLMEQFPQAPEGELTKLRSLLVNEEGLARISRALGLGELLLLGRGEELTGGRTKASVLADALEAVLGVAYLIGGMPKALELVDRHFKDALAGVALGRNGQDWKSRLQERAQLERKLSPRYRLVSQTGPDHERIFEIEVTIGDEAFGRATGRSKKEAEQAAAKETLERLQALDRQTE